MSQRQYAVAAHLEDEGLLRPQRAGFHECPVDPMMMITLAEVEKNLSPPSAS